MQKSFAWITVAANTTQTPHERKNKPTLSGYSGRRQMIHLLHTLLRPNGSGLWLGHLPTHLSPTRERTSIRFYYILVSHYHHYALCSHPPRQTFCCYNRPNHMESPRHAAGSTQQSAHCALPCRFSSLALSVYVLLWGKIWLKCILQTKLFHFSHLN